MKISVIKTFNPFYSLLRREISRFMKVAVQTIFTPLVNASLYLLIFGVSLGQNIQLKEGISYMAFLIPGLVMMAVLNNSFQNSSSSIVSGKFTGDLEDLRVSPLSATQILWALSFGGLIRGATVGLVTLLVGEMFNYFIDGQWLVVQHPLTLLIFLVMGGLSFAQLGIAVAMWAKNFDQMSAVTSFLLTPLIYLGGVFFSIGGLHPLWQKIAMINPLLYFINGVRYSMVGLSDVPVITALIISFLSLIVFQSIALYSLKRGQYSRW